MIWQTPNELFIASLPIYGLDFSSSVAEPQNWIGWVSGTEDTVEKGGVWDILLWQQQPSLKEIDLYILFNWSSLFFKCFEFIQSVQSKETGRGGGIYRPPLVHLMNKNEVRERRFLILKSLSRKCLEALGFKSSGTKIPTSEINWFSVQTYWNAFFFLHVLYVC